MSESDKILSQHEVDALLSAIDGGEMEIGGEEAGAKQAMPYDFKRPERVARDQLRALETLHEVLARNLQAALSGQLRTIVDVRVASVDQLTFSEFIHSLPNPTVFTVLSADPLEGSFILEMNPIIAFPIIERLLGSGRVSQLQPERALTEIEWKLIDRVIEHAVGIMRGAWSGVVDMALKVTTRESNPQIMQLYSANEPVISVVLELTMGEHKGYVNICVPVMSVEGIMERITSHMWFASRRKEPSPRQEGILSRVIAPAEVKVSAHLSIEAMRFQDLRRLREGDLLLTNHPETVPVLISVEGRPKFVGRLGRVKDRLAFRITGPLESGQEEVARTPRSEVQVIPSGGKTATVAEKPDVEPVLGIPVPATVVLAEKDVPLQYVLSLRQGDIIEFAKGVNQPLDLEVSSRRIAQGIAVKRGEKFGVQIIRIQDPRARIATLGT